MSCTHRDTHSAHTSCLAAFTGHTVRRQAAGRVQAEPLLQGAACSHWKIFADCNLAGLLDPAAQHKGCLTISTLHFTPHAALYTTALHIIVRHPIVRSNSAVCSRAIFWRENAPVKSAEKSNHFFFNFSSTPKKLMHTHPVMIIISCCCCFRCCCCCCCGQRGSCCSGRASHGKQAAERVRPHCIPHTSSF